MKNNRGLIILFTLLTQCLVIIAINHNILSANNLTSVKRFLPYVNIIVLFIFALTMISIKQLEEDAENRIKIMLLQKHVQEIEAMNLLFRTQKHEYARHMQYIQSLTYIREYEQLMDYINALAKDYRHTENLINTGHPAITTLLNTKRSTAESQGIELALAVKNDFSGLTIPAWDLNSILGNLIENAMEAAIEDRYPRVAVELSYKNGSYIIYISNNGSVLSDPVKIYEPGYTTKGSSSRGYGLFLVKKIIDQYGGEIRINTGRKTHFTVILPDGSGADDRFFLPEDSCKIGHDTSG